MANSLGFHIGVGDTVADEATMFEIARIIDEKKDKVAELVKQGQNNELESQPGRTMIQVLKIL